MKLKIKITMYSPRNCFMCISNEEGDSLFNNIEPRLAREIKKRLMAYKPAPRKRAKKRGPNG